MNILSQCSRIVFEKHTAPGPCSKYAPGAVCIQIMLLEHIWLRIFFQIISDPGLHGPGPYGQWAADPGYGTGRGTITQGQNFKTHVFYYNHTQALYMLTP